MICVFRMDFVYVKLKLFQILIHKVLKYVLNDNRSNINWLELILLKNYSTKCGALLITLINLDIWIVFDKFLFKSTSNIDRISLIKLELVC